jgi:hypothetical protein
MRSPLGGLSILLVLLLSACGGSPSPGGSAPRADRNLLTQEDFAAGDFSNAYDVVEALRNQWLRPRGVDSFRSPTEVKVYLDDARLGGVEELRTIPINHVVYIRYYDGLAASARWGLDHGQGAIYVSTRPPLGSTA